MTPSCCEVSYFKYISKELVHQAAAEGFSWEPALSLYI